ncbi:BRCA1-associated protein-like [Prunus yedoensis var. nudiflora]|uniref:BRCA1-associated protein-like n=1 Tax=Prunus yedoensis var. nudiflora TaxID=2094558 RepID=A0A314ZUZ2_PRUYE|nr:BRCA1-associated protein-like [Prunus yedoensis var. nudiflora]
MEDRYSVLVELKNQMTADGFYHTLNGKKYSPGEAEVCHILFLLSVDYTDSDEIAGTPPRILLEILVESIVDCTTDINCYLQVCRFCQQQDEKPACSVCGISVNPWVCVICGFVGCGRYTEGHAVRHWKDTQHCYSLELNRQQIWDYVGDAYVHRLNQSKIDGKLITDTDSQCLSVEGDCDRCECSDDSGISGALYSSKVETIVDEYNRLLASQLETQRQYYEALLMEAKSKKESSTLEAVEKAVNSKMLDIQAKLEKCLEERNAVEDINSNLIKDQETRRGKLKEIEVREAALLRLREEKMVDLEDQIRDLTVYIEAQKTLNHMTDSDGIKGGTLLPVPSSKQSSPANSRRQTKSGRRRN